VVNGVGGDANVGFAVTRQHRMAAVGVAGAARKVAAGHVDLDLMAGAERVTDVAEIDRQPFHAIRRCDELIADPARGALRAWSDCPLWVGGGR
jgi:hypothetical protein